MATKKTATASKAQTKAVTDDVVTSAEPVEEIKEVVASEKVEEVVKTEPKRKLKDGDYVMCRSVTGGGLNINCRSRNHYEFKDYNYKTEIEYRDLVELVRKHSDHIFVPRIVVEDKDFLEEFPELKKFYKEQYSVGDFKEILKLSPEQMEKEIKKLPTDVLPTVRSIAATMVGNGEIDSVRKVRKLTDIFGTDFNLLSELFGSSK